MELCIFTMADLTMVDLTMPDYALEEIEVDGELEIRMLRHLRIGLSHLCKEGELCDVTITVGEKTFVCHRLILSAVSRFFRSSLNSAWQESCSRVVVIEHEDVTAQSFQFLLDILYDAHDVITMDTVQDVLRMAIFLQISSLEEHCVSYLIENIEPANCLGIWQLAEKYELTALREKAINLAVTRFQNTMESKEFLQLPKSMLLILLASQTEVKSDQLLERILGWVKADEDPRRRHLGELLPFVGFIDLNPDYLSELVGYLNHPFRDAVFGYIDEALTYKLKVLLQKNKIVGRQILARQRHTTSSDFKRCTVLVGGAFGSGCVSSQQLSSFSDQDGDTFSMNTLKPIPQPVGTGFAACVWRNELYISGGSTCNAFFAVYKPGDGEWEVLPSLPRGREEHSMLADMWRIYVLGGVSADASGKKAKASDIVVYDVSKKEWSVAGQMALPVLEAASAVLGHRVYVFGGRDAEGNATDCVQCVDTYTGCCYQCGRLPAAMYGARALSDGGTIYIATSQGDVMSMKENFALADEREICKLNTDNLSESALGTDKEAIVETPESSLATSDSLAKVETLDSDTESAKDRLSSHQTLVSSIVKFKTICRFTARRLFGAYLHNDEMIVCGGEKDGEALHDVVGVNLKTGARSHKVRTLQRGFANFFAHELYIPKEFLVTVLDDDWSSVTFRHYHPPSSSSSCSKTVTMRKTKWYVRVKKTGQMKAAASWLAMELVMEQDKQRNRTHAVECKYRVLSACLNTEDITTGGRFTFSDIGTNTHQLDKVAEWSKFETSKFLTSSKFLHNGSIMIEVSIAKMD